MSWPRSRCVGDVRTAPWTPRRGGSGGPVRAVRAVPRRRSREPLSERPFSRVQRRGWRLRTLIAWPARLLASTPGFGGHGDRRSPRTARCGDPCAGVSARCVPACRQAYSGAAHRPSAHRGASRRRVRSRRVGVHTLAHSSASALAHGADVAPNRHLVISRRRCRVRGRRRGRGDRRRRRSGTSRWMASCSPASRAQDSVVVPAAAARRKGLTLLLVRRMAPTDLTRALRMVESGMVALGSLITRYRYPLDSGASRIRAPGRPARAQGRRRAGRLTQGQPSAGGRRRSRSANDERRREELDARLTSRTALPDPLDRHLDPGRDDLGRGHPQVVSAGTGGGEEDVVEPDDRKMTPGIGLRPTS